MCTKVCIESGFWEDTFKPDKYPLPSPDPAAIQTSLNTSQWIINYGLDLHKRLIHSFFGKLGSISCQGILEENKTS